MGGAGGAAGGAALTGVSTARRSEGPKTKMGPATESVGRPP